ncbi:hypothetical protein ACGFZP_05320 [Kitasatospora sp. NPDC048239]|uniref:hypothetical protein n=1 Tax=Kitasatospora sp. NPDC048239 TaxID=3364046 RepID=UPI003716CDE5
MSALDLAAQAAAMQAVVHLTRMAAGSGASEAPTWTVDAAGAVVGQFSGPRALMALDGWRQTIGTHSVWSDRVAGGLRWTIVATVQDVMVRLVAVAPARTAVAV